MTRRLARRATSRVTVTLLALLLGAALAAGPTLGDAVANAGPTPAPGAGVDGTARAVAGEQGAEIALILRDLDPLAGHPQAALRASGDRFHLRLTLVATAVALVSLVVALARVGRAGAMAAHGWRRPAFAPCGARAPPGSLPA